MKRLIVYDLDGTLVDTLADIAQAASHMLSRLQAPALTPSEIRRFIGDGVHELVARCLRTDEPDRINEGVRIYRTYYQSHLLDESRLYPGAEAILAHFAGRIQAVITNKPGCYSRKILEGLGVAHHFVEIIGGDMGYPRKPDPSSLKNLMSRHGVVADETLLIGDSAGDVDTAQRAGVDTVAITRGFSDEEDIRPACPTAIVSSFRELLTLAERHGW